jgi:hypothetical protein
MVNNEKSLKLGWGKIAQESQAPERAKGWCG